MKGNLFYPNKEKTESIDIPTDPIKMLEYDLEVIQDARCKAKLENFLYERLKEVE